MGLPRIRIQDDAPLADLRFCALLAPNDWMALPAPIRQRFTKRLSGGATVIYAGEVLETTMSRMGRFWAQAARLVGGPLPVCVDAGAAIVSVTEDGRTGGQNWTRIYARKSGFPQIIHSAKSFAGDTGLEECVGAGVGMALTVHVENGALVFRSKRYFLRIGARRVTLPAWLTPGRITVTHAELGAGRFTFTLEVDHPRFGRIIRQVAAFREAKP